MPDDNTDDIVAVGVLAIAGYAVWKVIGTGANEAQDFADIPQRAGHTIISGAETVGGDLWDGATDVAANAGSEVDEATDFVGGGIQDVTRIPGQVVGDTVGAAQDFGDEVIGGAQDAVDTINPFS